MDTKQLCSNLICKNFKEDLNEIIVSELLGEDMILSSNDLDKKIKHNDINYSEISNLGKKIMNMVNRFLITINFRT